MVAVCFEDIKASMYFSIKEVKVAIRENKMGECNKANDFVPLGSIDPIIKRSTGNTHSRKATLVWLHLMPDDLKLNDKELRHRFPNTLVQQYIPYKRSHYFQFKFAVTLSASFLPAIMPPSDDPHPQVSGDDITLPSTGHSDDDIISSRS